MEKSLENLISGIREEFALGDVDIRTYSPLVLAYIGDGIYELVIRSLLVGRGNTQAAKLHREASSLVNAGAQAAMLERIKEHLTEEELQIPLSVGPILTQEKLIVNIFLLFFDKF